jgi:hypothetical protein
MVVWEEEEQASRRRKKAWTWLRICEDDDRAACRNGYQREVQHLK